MNQTTIAQKANAKINLYLHVTGKLENGFHTLDSLVVFADVGDNITVNEAPNSNEISLKVSGPFGSDVPSDDSNLVIKAAKLFRDTHNVQMGAEILLEKNLPVSSGIGGGSADAAAVIRSLSDLWGLNTPALDLKTISQKLGADVPVCLMGKNVFMSGIGEILTPAPKLPQCWLVLANSGVKVSTPDVFKNRTGKFSNPARFEEAPKDAACLAEIIANRGNDLYLSAIALAPEIAEVIEALQGLDGALLARMSGSGATCFGIFAGEKEALAGALRLAQNNPNWWIAAAKMLNHT
ncbi:MAG: 4-(cytidine 5'-diphospho)-2-C-methyl-D-erythritol kinase [Rhodospirillaceae bacterium]|nr:4-(cytidine 5'-diphospho)-2-C-methyl-D-erythritol kinase [Rhodospirillaceae bacterium]